MENMFRSAEKDDAKAICGIYNHYIQNTTVTFEEQLVSTEEMESRILRITGWLPWLVWVEQEEVSGFALASPWKSRCAYQFSVESTIYLAPELTGRGIGRQLYGALLADLRVRSFHTVIGSIALPNPASIALHERMGFEKVGHFRRVGWKFGKWIDVGYWQLLLGNETASR